ncbi:MAG: hypothetical protein KDC92_08210 [Bacteroidetes bacterium]|nr:hypothetical protein [Bacteroidota bacterium]
MRIEFYKGGKLELTEQVKSWNHFEILINQLAEGRYKLVVYKENGPAVRTISIKNKQMTSKSSEAPIKEVVSV